MANKINFNAIRKMVPTSSWTENWPTYTKVSRAELAVAVKKASKETLVKFALLDKHSDAFGFFGVKSPSQRAGEEHAKNSATRNAVLKKIDELELKYAIGDTTDADLKALLVAIQSLNKN